MSTFALQNHPLKIKNINEVYLDYPNEDNMVEISEASLIDKSISRNDLLESNIEYKWDN